MDRAAKIAPGASRREFLSLAAAAPLAAVAASRVGAAERAPFPYVDGLSFLSPDPGDLGKSGLAAIILDISSVARVPTTDGSIRYFRSFEACAQSITKMRRELLSGRTPGARLITHGSEIRQAYGEGTTGIVFQFQGCEPIGEALWRLDLFYELGLRVLQITHHNDNAWGGGAIEKNWSGLTKVGREGVERLNALGIVPDVSHGSDLTAIDTVKTSRKPVILSHGGARAFVNNARCAPDEVIRAVAGSGGVMGIFMMTMWLTTEAPTVDAYVRQIRHVVKVGGIEAVGIANDYTVAGQLEAAKLNNDNARAIEDYYAWWDSVAAQGVLGFDTRPQHVVIPELNNVRRMFLIHAALEKAGFAAREIELIMGGNWMRVLTDTLG